MCIFKVKADSFFNFFDVPPNTPGHEDELVGSILENLNYSCVNFAVRMMRLVCCCIRTLRSDKHYAIVLYHVLHYSIPVKRRMTKITRMKRTKEMKT